MISVGLLTVALLDLDQLAMLPYSPRHVDDSCAILPASSPVRSAQPFVHHFPSHHLPQLPLHRPCSNRHCQPPSRPALGMPNRPIHPKTFVVRIIYLVTKTMDAPLDSSPFIGPFPYLFGTSPVRFSCREEFSRSSRA